MSTPPVRIASQIPQSVHFIVTETAALQVAELTNTTCGLDYIDRQWPPLVTMLPSDINAPFIHIGLFYTDNPLNRHLVDLLCCIFMEYEVIFPILAGSDLQSDRPYHHIDPSLITCVANCVASGGSAPPNPIQINDRLDMLEQCCLANRAAIHAHDQRLYRVEEELSSLRTRVTNLERTVRTLEEAVQVIPQILEQIRILQEQIAGILDRCCPDDDDDQACFQYQINRQQDWQLVPPTQPRWLNLPAKIRDAEPPVVTPGPLWKAKLLGTCTWNLKGLVRFKLTEWCQGKTIKLYLVYCGQPYLVDSHTIPFTGMQSVSLDFTIPIPPGCTDVHLLVEHNDLIAKTIEFANFEGCAEC